jgi:hypothetical protein
MSRGEHVEPFRRLDIEKEYWVSEFLPWLRTASFDPRNQESIDTIFWWWYINVKFPTKPNHNER